MAAFRRAIETWRCATGIDFKPSNTKQLQKNVLNPTPKQNTKTQTT
jgi:hypothetical protein